MTAPTAGIRVLAVLFVTALTAALSQVSFPLPFTPVPFTLQPMVVLLGGAALGARLGATSQILYLMLGVAGLPVFAYAPELPQGLLRLLGPVRRLPDGLPAGSVRHRLARRSAASIAASARRSWRWPRALASCSRAACCGWRKDLGVAPALAAGSIRSCSWTRSRSWRRRPCCRRRGACSTTIAAR